MTEPLAYLAGLHTHGGIVAWIVTGQPSEDIDADGPFLQSVGLAIQGPLHYVA